MAIPDPRPGLVLSYAYLWHHEHQAGREEGVKNRPCVIVVAVQHPDGINTIVRVAPVTHSPSDNLAAAFELPSPVKRHLGLDAERSWVILDEVNEFAWPGFDLQPVPRVPDSFAYGFLPPRLFDQLIMKLTGYGTKGWENPRLGTEPPPEFRWNLRNIIAYVVNERWLESYGWDSLAQRAIVVSAEIRGIHPNTWV